MLFNILRENRWSSFLKKYANLPISIVTWHKLHKNVLGISKYYGPLEVYC